MIAAGKDDIRTWYKQGVEDGYQYMLVVYDRMDYPENSDAPYYYHTAEEAEEALHEFSRDELSEVMEIYDFSMDMEAQLAEKRAWHLPGYQEEEESEADMHFSMGRMMYEGNWPLYSEEEQNNEALRCKDAAEYFDKAAQLGHGEAALMLGLMYAVGRGVEKDTAKAREWVEKAEEYGMEFDQEDKEKIRAILED